MHTEFRATRTPDDPPVERAVMTKILVVDDDRKLVNLVRLYLERSGYTVITAYDGAQGLALARQHQPALIVLDLMMPEMDGLEVCRQLQGEFRIPVIMLTARAQEDDKIAGLSLGADDYVTKPFSPRELVARVNAVLRRAGEQPPLPGSVLVYRDLRVDLARHEVWRGDTLIPLTATEFKLLDMLIRQPNRVFTRLDLVNHVFGWDYTGLERTVDVHVYNLRRKLEPDPANPHYLHTVYGVGYRLGSAPNHA